MKKGLALYIIAFFSSFIYSQQYNFINFGVKDGLAQSQVTDICQDNMGNLWIGTQSGLSKFDSKTFKNYSIDNGLSDNSISKLLITKDNDIWVATSKGISIYKNDKFHSFYFDKSEKVNDLIEFKGQLLIATNHTILLFNGESFSLFLDEKIESKRFRSLVSIKDSIIFCATNKGLFEYKSKTLQVSDIVKPELSLSNIVYDNNKLYIASFNSDIIRYDLQNKSIKTIHVENIPIRSLFIESDAIWAASNFGLIEIIDKNITHYTENNGLTINSVKKVFKDFEGNLWVGTYGKGLFKFSGKSLLTYTENDGLNSDIIMSIAQHNNGDFIFGSYNKGVNLYLKNKSISHLSNQNGLKHNSVWATFVDQSDNCWLGTSSGLQCYKNGGFKNLKSTNNINSKIRSICQSKNGEIYFGGKNGLWQLKNDSVANLLNGSEFDINKVSISESKLFLGTRNGLFWQDIPNINEPFKQIVLPENYVNTICIDSYGNCWTGTINGLFVISKNLDIRLFELSKNTYKSKNILGLIMDSKKRIWVSTTNGVYLISAQNPNRATPSIYHYTSAEGLIDMESNLNALFEDKQGHIWVGTSSGLVRIDPSLNPIFFNYNIPKLTITGLRLFKDKFDYSQYKFNGVFQNGIPNNIVFPYKKNHLTFDFIGINNKNPKNVSYTYRLLGAEKKWSSITQENNASYSFISPGEYQFQVKSANKNMEWTEPVTLNFTIQSPYWKKWWFILGVILGALGIIYLIFTFKVKNIKHKKDNEKLIAENKLRNLEQRSLNASMNRHFIFNSLNSIQYFINSSDKKSANKYLTNFAQLIRKNLDSSTQPNFSVNLNQEIERINLYLSLEKMRFNKKFDYTVKVEDDLDTEMIQVPSMILQPFVENSIIHGVLPKSTKGHILINIKSENESIIFEVEDDGVGIDFSLKGKDKFEGDHKSQGMEITANRIELLRKINGEKLMIIGPFQIDKDNKIVGTKVIIKLPIY